MNRKSINLTQKQIENRALIVTTVVNAIITGAGIWMYFLTDLQMMFLDGFFSLIGLLSALAAVLISKVFGSGEISHLEPSGNSQS